MSHWYDDLGNPKYEIVGANGVLRDTTLRDARKLNLFYSITTVGGIPKSETLNNWQMNQLLEAMLDHPYPAPISYVKDLDGKPQVIRGSADSVNKWKGIISSKADEIRKNTSKRGNELHNALEGYFKTHSIANTDKDIEFVLPILELIDTRFKLHTDKWVSEASFSHHLGFGGRLDLYTSNGQGIIIDFKSKDLDDLSNVKQYDTQTMQLAAQRLLINMPKAQCYNLFIGTKKPGVLKLLPEVWNDKEHAKINNAEKMFLHLLEFKKLSEGHFPSIKSKEVDLNEQSK